MSTLTLPQINEKLREMNALRQTMAVYRELHEPLWTLLDTNNHLDMQRDLNQMAKQIEQSLPGYGVDWFDVHASYALFPRQTTEELLRAKEGRK